MSNEIPLFVQSDGSSSHQPITVGIPLPVGQYQPRHAWRLMDAAGQVIPLQTAPLALWPDGSVRWLLLDFIAGPLASGTHRWQLGSSADFPPTPARSVAFDATQLTLATGAAFFRVGTRRDKALFTAGRDPIDPAATLISTLTLTDAPGAAHLARIRDVSMESTGPIRATACIRGEFSGAAPCRFVARLCFFAGLGTVRFRITLHNPRRARRRGNLWDLGDPGSIQFRDLTLEFRLNQASNPRIHWIAELGNQARESKGSNFEVFQASSGGENWRSRNHVNRHGRSPMPFRGFRVRFDGGEERGLRASPLVQRVDAPNSVSVAVPEFWQQFPKAMEVQDQSVVVRLFPKQFGDLFELQGGEQKTHTVWMDLSAPDARPDALSWVHRPATARLSPEACAESGAFPDMLPLIESGGDRFDDYANRALSGPTSIVAGREVIDEYGWRNFGDIYADHENAFAPEPRPIVSHYNNQFDSIYGALLQFARTGDSRWRELADPLARHVIDIDIYHTDEDRAAYRGGLFWMTDHYKDAATSTHRTFSRANQKAGQSYGGGPGSEHNFTSGLLYYHCMTGDPLARDAVISLADWVIRMDDGNQNRLRRLDGSPTGLASMTGGLDYHGPGRGAGLSINALIDGWLLTGRDHYLRFAETLIRRCIHPRDDLAARDLLDIERRWSYTIFLTSLARFLRVKVEAGECDFMYGYARASLVHYAEWMAANEIPYFDQRSRMEFPTETWAAQDFRKANVLRLAAAYVDEPLRQQFLDRASFIANRAWKDLLSFDSRHVARAVAIILTEGTRDQSFCRRQPKREPLPERDLDFGAPEEFVPQKTRIKSMIRSPRGWARMIGRLAQLWPGATS